MEREIEEFKKNESEENAAKVIVALIDHRENVYWDDDEGRLRLAKEAYDERLGTLMKALTKALDVKNRSEYTKKKHKYNLTQF
ncbi:MAG: hypothetical protein V3R86_00250 [Candidatus Hydrothermarchaeaceae archaeon]